MREEELDELKWWLSDEHLYRYALSQLITLAHVWLSWLAFREDVRFFRGRSRARGGGGFAGLSVSSLASSAVPRSVSLMWPSSKSSTLSRARRGREGERGRG